MPVCEAVGGLHKAMVCLLGGEDELEALRGAVRLALREAVRGGCRRACRVADSLQKLLWATVLGRERGGRCCNVLQEAVQGYARQ